MAKVLRFFIFFLVSFFLTPGLQAGQDSEKKSFFHAYNPKVFLASYNPVNIYNAWTKEQQQCEEELPKFWKSGYHKHGRYDQFTVDRRAAVEAIGAGLFVRFLYCCGHFGTKLETIKSAILIPGAAKAGLYWGASCAVYKWRKSAQAYQDLESEVEKLAQQHVHNLKKQQEKELQPVQPDRSEASQKEQ